MTHTEMITLLRQHLSDEQSIGWRDDSELTVFIERATALLSDKLIAMKDPVMLRKITLVPVAKEDIAFLDEDIAFLDDDPLVFFAGASSLPDDFVALVGNVPVAIVGRDVCVDSPMDILYWARLTPPFTHKQALTIVDIARLFALNKNEFDISPDMTLIGEISKAMGEARSK